jgi:curli biogenesis system outer membrane secretion channel CsgG
MQYPTLIKERFNGNLFYLFVVIYFISASGCATTYVERDAGTSAQMDPLCKAAVIPAYSGPKTVIAVLPLGLSDRAAKRYPRLLDKNVGMGLHNMLTEKLYDTRRYTFVEDKQNIIKDAMDRQWMSANGMVARSRAIEMGKMLGAVKVIYGEVYDFGEGGEKIRGFSSQKNIQTRMGIQIRCVDVETLEYIPASGIGFGADVSSAANQAIQHAVVSLMRRTGN